MSAAAAATRCGRSTCLISCAMQLKQDASGKGFFLQSAVEILCFSGNFRYLMLRLELLNRECMLCLSMRVLGVMS